MAGTPERPAVAEPRAREAEAGASAAAADPEDFRVRCSSRRAVAGVLELCGRVVRGLGDALPENVRELALRDVQWTFEAAVQENISINGQDWQDASGDGFVDSDIKVLEDEFDEIIVGIATRRKQYPRKILECVIRTLKAQHETLKQYHPVVHPLDLQSEPDPASHMEKLKYRGEGLAKKINEIMKALPALIEQGNGFSQVLKMQPVLHMQSIHQEVFAGCYGKPNTQPERPVSPLETMPPSETASRKSSNVVLKRKHPQDCAQSRCYPLRPKRINLDT